jgi:hypothetical protein
MTHSGLAAREHGRRHAEAFGPGPTGGPSILRGDSCGGDRGGMFLAEEVIVGTGSGQAQARFVSLLHGNWLATASQAAYGETVTGLLRVGPSSLVAAKLVQVSFLDPIYRDDMMNVGLRWEAAGTTGGLSPVLDATITIGPDGDKTARLALAGSYRRPLGRLGAALDTALLHRVATATVRSLLHSVADAITSPVPAENGSRWWRPAPEPGMS